MKVTVCRLFRDGRPDPSIRESIAGDLNLSRRHHPILGREVVVLRLIADERGSQPVEPLMDAYVYEISADGMFWRGIEAGPKDQQLAQEWFVRSTQE